MQDLGEQLMDLSAEQLDAIDLDGRLRDAVVCARSITARGALRRQKQLIGKLMRNVDPEPIQQALQSLQHNDRQAKRVFHEAERWRSRLIDGGDEAFRDYLEFLGDVGSAISDSLQAHRSASNDKSRKTAARELFREVRDDIERKVQKEAGSI